MRIGQAIQKSTEVLTAMNQLVRMPEVAQTMRQLGMEMMKVGHAFLPSNNPPLERQAGLIDETINDAMESLDEPNAEAEADAEVDKVLTEVVRGTLDKVVPVRSPVWLDTERHARRLSGGFLPNLFVSTPNLSSHMVGRRASIADRLISLAAPLSLSGCLPSGCCPG